MIFRILAMTEQKIKIFDFFTKAVKAYRMRRIICHQCHCCNIKESRDMTSHSCSRNYHQFPQHKNRYLGVNTFFRISAITRRKIEILNILKLKRKTYGLDTSFGTYAILVLPGVSYYLSKPFKALWNTLHI
jgi:hypothetical protein